jgi:hypothetical protein
VHSFANLDEAVAAIAAVVAEPTRQARAAREIADQYFDARKVLPRLIEDALG